MSEEITKTTKFTEGKFYPKQEKIGKTDCVAWKKIKDMSPTELKQYHKLMRERTVEQRREYGKKWREDNRERVNEYMRDVYLNNPKNYMKEKARNAFNRYNNGVKLNKSFIKLLLEYNYELIPNEKNKDTLEKVKKELEEEAKGK